jgi:hypothetical protein
VNQPFSVDPELFMLHLKFYDRDHLRDTAARRSAMVAEDGRAERSNWRRGAELSRMIRRLTADADPDAAPEFDPRSVDLDPLVIKGHGSRYRTRRQGQVGAMRTRPLVRIPSRLKGAL